MYHESIMGSYSKIGIFTHWGSKITLSANCPAVSEGAFFKIAVKITKNDLNLVIETHSFITLMSTPMFSGSKNSIESRTIPKDLNFSRRPPKFQNGQPNLSLTCLLNLWQYFEYLQWNICDGTFCEWTAYLVNFMKSSFGDISWWNLKEDLLGFISPWKQDSCKIEL